MMVEKVPDSTYEMVGGLDKQIKELEEAADTTKESPDLTTVVKKLKAAENHAAQCTEHYLKLQRQLEEAQQRATTLRATTEVAKLAIASETNGMSGAINATCF